MKKLKLYESFLNEKNDNIEIARTKYTLIEKAIKKIYNETFVGLHGNFSETNDTDAEHDEDSSIIFGFQLEEDIEGEIEIDRIIKFKTELSKHHLHFYRILYGNFEDDFKGIEFCISIKTKDVLNFK